MSLLQISLERDETEAHRRAWDTRGRKSTRGTSYASLVARVSKADGGFTHRLVDGIEPVHGFAVSPYRDREQVLNTSELTVAAIARYVQKNRDLVRQKGVHLGAWHNPDDDKVYLDLSQVVQSAKEAKQLGREHGQLAYFDLKAGRSVTIEDSRHGHPRQDHSVYRPLHAARESDGGGFDEVREGADWSDADGGRDRRRASDLEGLTYRERLMLLRDEDEAHRKAWDTRGRGRADLHIAGGPPKDKPVVLVFGGSFNPPHEGHKAAALNAATTLTDAGYNVSHVIVAPTADKLIKAKLGDKTYPLAERAKLSELAFDDPRLEVSAEPALAAEVHVGKLRRTQLADWAKAKYPGHTVIAVAGEDSAPPTMPDVVKLGKFALYSGDAGTSHEGYYYLVAPRSTDSPSSTVIRAAIREGKTPPHMNARAAAYLKTMLAKHPSVQLTYRERLALLLRDEAEAHRKAWDTRGRNAAAKKAAAEKTPETPPEPKKPSKKFRAETTDYYDSDIVERVLGKGVDAHIATMMGAAFAASLPGESEAVVKVSTDPEHDHADKGRAVIVRVKDAGGVDITREFYRQDGKLVAHHDLMKLDKKLQGQGVARRVLLDSLTMYDKIGFDRIEMLANLDVGSYAWARMGFQAAHPHDLSVIVLRKLGAALGTLPDADYRFGDAEEGKKLARVGSKAVLQKFRDVVEKNKQNPNLPSIIANTWNGDKHIGKTLLGKTSWDAVLNLKDKTARATIGKYLHAK